MTPMSEVNCRVFIHINSTQIHNAAEENLLLAEYVNTFGRPNCRLASQLEAETY